MGWKRQLDELRSPVFLILLSLNAHSRKGDVMRGFEKTNVVNGIQRIGQTIYRLIVAFETTTATFMWTCLENRHPLAPHAFWQDALRMLPVAVTSPRRGQPALRRSRAAGGIASIS